ncbi:tagaturonate reductase [Mucilaginibacter glaciei]|uniref:Tagaturonate reductase n=1 Tax=Mucilaginibacter glaciei TaxID=2772109 RepID=A0A926NVB1_9SPHI|nr:tagaturonate reductase [Mucilaginibacter glaciei]MBD1395360.1 tagaturonate reductase [Mucilaginibacter glaciei]
MLSKNNLPNATGNLIVPAKELFDLPEKVLQFGTGVLLRGLPDYYIDKANRQGVFNGRVVVVKSTTTGDTADFDQQDCLYTLHVKGIAGGKEVDEQVINSAISRVLSAATQWADILNVAHNKELKIVLSNTTEVGLQFLAESIGQTPPESFPGKLLAFLLERYRAFNGDMEAGLVIIPTELVIDNGKLLKQIIMQLATYNQLEDAFTNWLTTANHFCNSLVDRIVPGKPVAAENSILNQRSGYKDNLRIVAEPYSLWAIEGGPDVEAALSFCRVDSGVVITPDIEKFRELKLRLLNGTHTLCCAVAILAGFKTVDEAMRDKSFINFINRIMTEEIKPSIPYPVDKEEAALFARNVIDRFSNPYIKHQWMSISAQYSLKMRTRVIPLLANYENSFRQAPQLMAFGFAAFIAFMQVEQVNGKFEGKSNGVNYLVTDNSADVFAAAWKTAFSDGRVVDTLLSDLSLWGTDLTSLPGFKEEVSRRLEQIKAVGILNILQATY